MQIFYSQLRMSDYLPAALYIKFIPFQAQIEKSQADLQFVYKQETNQALGSLHFFLYLKSSETRSGCPTMMDLKGTQHDKMDSV